MNWQSKHIPDFANLYIRVHKALIKKDGSIARSAFKDHNGGMSTDWDRYSTPEETRARGNKPAQDYAVVGMNVEGIRYISPELEVEHTPDFERNNRAHTDVIGEKDTEARTKLKRLSTWQIRLD